jgi:hypothetical protein
VVTGRHKKQVSFLKDGKLLDQAIEQLKELEQKNEK